MAMKIAILSDIHAGLDSTAQDLCPHELLSSEQAKVEYSNKQVDYISRFLSFVRNEKLKADYLLVPGDITDKAYPVETKMASECIEKISKELAIPSNNVLFVPGNHDACWKMHDVADSMGIMWNHRYLALQSEKFIFAGINKRAKSGNIFSEGYYNLWMYEDLIVVGYNSSSQEMPTDKIRCGSIVDEHLQSLEKTLKKFKIRNDNRIKIFMLHHHIHDFKMPKGSQQDHSLAHNGESLVSLLRKFKFDFILHGHRHYSCFDAQNCVIPIFCAGSFSAKISTEWVREVSNQFHIIEIETKTKQMARIRGFIYSWSNTPDGWERSPEYDNRPIVGYQRAFGCSLDYKRVAKKIKDRIAALAREKKWFNWLGDIEASIQELKYMSQTREEIVDWCKEEALDSSKWNIFVTKDNNVLFCKDEECAT